jgi:hypothetical protein
MPDDAHMGSEQPVVREIGDLTAEWLEGALGAGPIAGFETERIGTG